MNKLRQRLLKEISLCNEAAIANFLSHLSEKERGAVLNPKVDHRTTSYTEDPLHFAIRNRLTQSVELFLPYIKNINRQPFAVGTPLHAASQHGLTKVVKLLLARKDLDLNAKNYAYGAGPFGGEVRHRTALQTLMDYLHRFGDSNNTRSNIAKLIKHHSKTC